MGFLRKIKYHRLVIVAILVLLVIYNYYGEKCALADGYGWDGDSYYRPILINGWEEYTSDNISYYHTHRMLPFLFIHWLMRLLNMSFSAPHVMLICSTVNALLLLFSVLLFFGISNHLRWKRNTEILAFSFSFLNYHVLKFMGYCPVMTDMPAYFLSWLVVYGFFLKKNWILFLVGLIGMFVFPILSLIAFLLSFLCIRIDMWNDTKNNRLCNAFVRGVFMFWVPLAFMGYVIFRIIVRGASSFQEVFIARSSISIWISVLALLAYVIFYYYATKPLAINWEKTFLSCVEKPRIYLIGMYTLFFVGYYFLPTIHGYSGPFSLINELAQICQFPATDILIFVETHFLYLGIGFVLILLYWKEICDATKRLGLGYFILTLLSLLFMSDIETRKIIGFYILLLIPLMSHLDKYRLSGRMVIFLFVVQLIFSFFWLPINVEGINKAFYTYQVNVYMQWPSQRYYMFQGPWQAHKVYGVALIVELIFIFILYRWKKNLSIWSI